MTSTPADRLGEPLPRERGRLLHLEAARGMAALYVVLQHANLFPGTHLHALFSFGQEAVMLFFLLSGFVIYYSSHGNGKPFSARTYLKHRVRRIWPLFLAALAFGYLLLSLLHHGLAPLQGRQLAGNLLMLQDVSALKPGVWFDTFGGDAPLWSLSYEWWFYLLFIPVTIYLRPNPRLQKVAVLVLSLLACALYEIRANEPCLILGYFFIWWVGVECGREYVERGTVSLRRQASSIAMLGLLAVAWSLPAMADLLHGRHPGLGVYPLLPVRHAGSALLFLLVGLAWTRLGSPGFRYFGRPFCLLAPISYALYVLHYPLLQYLAASTRLSALTRLGVAMLVLVPLCYLLEVKLRPVCNRWVDALFALFEPRPIHHPEEIALAGADSIQA